jgi:PilZ domain-containing protein
MQLFCDRCNEAADHPISITSDPELAEIARDLGYRNVCPGCYDDLLIEAGEAREHQADDRRSEHRVAAQVPLRVSPAGGGESHTTMTEDISDNGAQIRASTALHAGEVVRLEAAGGNVEAFAIVEVIWADGDALRAGLRLVETSESWQQLVRDCESKQPES